MIKLGSFQTYVRIVSVLMLVAFGAAMIGCQPTQADSRVTQIQQLEDRIERQGRDLASKDAQIQAQAEQIQALQGLEGDRALDRLVHVTAINIDDLSGGYDDNRDGRDDGLVIYLRLLDGEQDAIKASGALLVRVMDLAATEGPELLGDVRVEPNALKSMWYGKLLTSHYAIKVPFASLKTMPTRDRLTVRVLYTDLLTGSPFDAQAEVRFGLPTAVAAP